MSPLRAAAVLALALVVALPAALAQGPNDIPDSAASGVPDANIPATRVSLYQQILDEGNLQVFSMLLNQDQKEYLMSATGRATVFAPSDSAFANLAREVTQYKISISDSDPAAIINALTIGINEVSRLSDDSLPDVKHIIAYHMLGDAYPLQTIEANETWPTLAGIELGVYDGQLVDMDDRFNTSIQKRNIFATNGWLNVIPHVLIPFDLNALLPSFSINPTMSPTSSTTPTPSESATPAPDETTSATTTSDTAPSSDDKDTDTDTATDNDSDSSDMNMEEPTMSSSPVAAVDMTTAPTDADSIPDGDDGDDGDVGDDGEGEEGGAGASVSPDPDDDDSVCFPASATVTTRNGKAVRMDQLTLGTHVRHAVSSSGHDEYSPVFLFTHRAAYKKGRAFVKISTDCGHAVTMSHSHYLRLADRSLAAAGSVRVGERVNTVSGVCAVKDVQAVRDDGLFAPHATHGDADLVVNGIVVSSYSKAVHPKVAHALLAPIRFVARRVEVSKLHNTVVDRLFRDGADWWAAHVMPHGQDRH